MKVTTNLFPSKESEFFKVVLGRSSALDLPSFSHIFTSVLVKFKRSLSLNH